MTKECEVNYTWALNAFRSVVQISLVVMMADRELALINAIEVVFPATKRLLCVCILRVTF